MDRSSNGTGTCSWIFIRFWPLAVFWITFSIQVRAPEQRMLRTARPTTTQVNWAQCIGANGLTTDSEAAVCTHRWTSSCVWSNQKSARLNRMTQGSVVSSWLINWPKSGLNKRNKWSHCICLLLGLLGLFCNEKPHSLENSHVPGQRIWCISFENIHSLPYRCQ